MEKKRVIFLRLENEKKSQNLDLVHMDVRGLA
jgi:hypothetical protein